MLLLPAEQREKSLYRQKKTMFLVSESIGQKNSYSLFSSASPWYSIYRPAETGSGLLVIMSG